jgi:hypothetical protein
MIKMADDILKQESPMKQTYDNFDIENIGMTPEQYKIVAMRTPINITTSLLFQDWERRCYAQNVIGSAIGQSGSGKSSFLSACALKLSRISRQVGKYAYDPFTIENVYYEPEEMQQRIPNLRMGEILLRDEHLHGQAGMMSDLTSSVLSDAEQQLRKNRNSFFFASIEEQDHAHFFVFEMKHIVPDENGYPRFTIGMLKTPLYTDPSVFVWRGLVAMPFPKQDYWVKYEKRKEEHITKLKNQYGNTLTPVEIDAIKIYKKRHDDLLTKTREGITKPIKDESMDWVVTEEIGTRKYTNKGYSLLKDKIKTQIIKEFATSNDEIMEQVKQQKEKDKSDKKEIMMLQIAEAKRIKEAKMMAFQEKLAEDKRRNDLKARALELREKELIKSQELKQFKQQAKQETESIKIEKKKNELKEAGNPAHHFAEDLI